MPITQWISALPEAASAISELLCHVHEDHIDSRIVVNETDITLDADFVAGLGTGTAGVLGLPPATTLALDIKPVGRIDEDSFHLKITWVRLGGQPVRANLSGALLKAEGNVWRVPKPLWSLHKAAQRLSVPLEKADRFQALSDLKVIWADESHLPITSDAYLKEIRVHYAAALSLKLRTLTPDITEFDPILFGSNLKEASAEGAAPDEDWDNILSPRAQKLFAEDRFRREQGVRPVYVLKDGEYIFVDPDLRPILNTVRTLQDSVESERRAFILNPRQVLRDKIGVKESETLSFERLFIETEQFSQRVAGVDIWRKTVLPWVLPSGSNNWLPEKFGLKVAEDYYHIAPQNLQPIIDRFEAAQVAQKPSVDVAGLLEPVRSDDTAPMALPINAQTRAAVASLGMFATATAADVGNGFSEPDNWEAKLAEKVFLVVRENFEEVQFSSLAADIGEIPNLTVPVSVPALLKTDLKPHQQEGLEWLVRSVQARQTGVLLADDMGLGKTLQAIALMAWLREDMAKGGRPMAPFLIVAPTGLLGNWQDEIRKHLKAPWLGRLVLAFGGDLKYLREESGLGLKDIETGRAALNAASWHEAGVVLTTYETLRDYHFSFARSRFALIVYDEIQKLKNPVSQMTRASKALNADFVLGMTGTPVENRLQDLWSIMDVISPGLLGSSRDFEKRYPSTNAARLQELKGFLTSAESGKPPYMLRRLKSDALKGLPTKTITPYIVDMPERQATAYASVVARAAAGAASGTLGTGGMLQILAHMRGVSLHPVDPELAPNNLDDYARDSARLAKTLEILEGVCERKERALIFVEDLAMQERLAGLIYSRFKLDKPPMRINGSVPGPKRQDMVRAFQEDAHRFGVMILSPKAGGVGLTLTAANHVIHLSRWWNPAVEDQATDRVFRIGQTRKVYVHLPLAAHPSPAIRDSSFDLRLHALLERKRQLTRDLFMPPEADQGDIGDLFNEVAAGGHFPAENDSDSLQVAEPDIPSVEETTKPRPVLTLGSKVIERGAKVWRVPAGRPRPTAAIFALFAGRDIGDVVIRDPYALTKDRSMAAQVDFLAGLRQTCRSLASVTIEYCPDDLSDDAFSRRSFHQKIGTAFPDSILPVNLKRRAKRSLDDDFHDRSVALNVRNASGALQLHELLIGRGLEALFNEQYECTVTYSPPT